MKTQLTSVLLCLLLSTSLGHDYHRAKSFAHQNRRSHHLSHFLERDSAPLEQCVWECEGNFTVPGGRLEVLANETTDLVALLNVTANVALILDLKADLVGLFNGTSGAVIVINITTNIGVYLAQDQSHLGWLSSEENFEEYFRKLTSLKIFLDLNEGTKFNASSCSDSILELVANILSSLSVSLGLQIQGQLKLSLTVLLNLSVRLSGLLNGPLNGLLGLVGRLLITIGGDLSWLVEVLEGLGLLLSEIPGGLSALLEAKVELDIAVLLGARDGIELLVNLLLAVVTRIDLGILSNLLNNLERLLSVLVKLGGGVSWGLNGVLNVVGNIVSLINGHVSIDVVINALIGFSASRSTEIDLSLSLRELDSVIRIQGSLHSPNNISGLVKIVESLQNGSLIVGNINVSDILKVLIDESSNGIELIVSILLKLSDVVKPIVAIPRLLLSLLTSLNASSGVHLIESLIPGLSIKVTATGGVDWKAALKGVNIPQILRYIATGNIDGLLKSLPIIKNIYETVSDALKAVTNGSLDLSELLKGAGSLIGDIISWITESLGLSVPHIGGNPGGTIVTLKPGLVTGIGPVVVTGGIFGSLG